MAFVKCQRKYFNYADLEHPIILSLTSNIPSRSSLALLRTRLKLQERDVLDFYDDLGLTALLPADAAFDAADSDHVYFKVVHCTAGERQLEAPSDSAAPLAYRAGRPSVTASAGPAECRSGQQLAISEQNLLKETIPEMKFQEGVYEQQAKHQRARTYPARSDATPVSWNALGARACHGGGYSLSGRAAEIVAEAQQLLPVCQAPLSVLMKYIADRINYVARTAKGGVPSGRVGRLSEKKLGAAGACRRLPHAARRLYSQPSPRSREYARARLARHVPCTKPSDAASISPFPRSQERHLL
jgi:AraC-like DNA-binding protein